ncbi:hypothetical protein LWI29_028834 [Acer saccharum]|uniref:Uncharacterized protein n=1 Tax=Acer saccharum TaxID=4024 RepID=A0AA39W360_ACESA|nr:hypothetical protein LWI29_028834 [Acer saccharum]
MDPFARRTFDYYHSTGEKEESADLLSLEEIDAQRWQTRTRDKRQWVTKKTYMKKNVFLEREKMERCSEEDDLAPATLASITSNSQSTAVATRQVKVRQAPAAQASVALDSQTTAAATSCDSSNDFVTAGTPTIADIKPRSALPSETATSQQSPPSVTAPPLLNKHPMITRTKNNIHKPVQ